MVGGYTGYYQWMIKSLGFTEEHRKVCTFNAAPFIADPTSGMQGYITSEPPAVKKEGGFDPDIWLLADNGYTSYSTMIQTLNDTVAKKPEVVQCFVDGSIKGWYTYLYGDNAKANAMIKADNPDMTDEQIAFSIAKLREHGIVDSGVTATMGVGAMTDARIKDFYDKMVAAGVIDTGIDISKAYTLAFVDKGVGIDLKPK